MKIQSFVRFTLSRIPLRPGGGSGTPLIKRPAAENPLRSQIFTREELAQHARGLAWAHRVRFYGRSGNDLFRRFEENCLEIEKAYYVFADATGRKEAITHGAEWLLDNYPVVEQQIRDIRKHLPRSYYRTLPKLLSDEYRGYPRVYHLALEVIAHNDAAVDSDLLGVFIQSYQSHAQLTIGELWAVPIMLRLALIENLRRLAAATMLVQSERHAAEALVDSLVQDSNRTGTDILLDLAGHLKDQPELLDTRAVYLLRRLRNKGLRAALTLQWLEERLREKGIDPDELVRREHQADAANQISIANTVTSLKTVSSLNWRDWVESMSKVHEILVQDPAGAYARSDFMTRDLCRHRIERLARALGGSEIEVAGKAVELAAAVRSQCSAQEPAALEDNQVRFQHVGYYLLDDGLARLEAALSYRPSIWVRLARFFKNNAFLVYASSIAILTFAVLFALSENALRQGTDLPVAAVLLLLAVVPASALAMDLVQWIITHLTTPFVLPKLDFESGVPDEHRTMVVVHGIFNDKEAISRFVENLEVRHLANDDANIFFAMLADLPDAAEAVMPGDQELIEYAEEQICELNSKYQRGDRKRFFLLFRKRLWNAGEGRFMGWERKRGKLNELNRLILGAEDTTFIHNVVDLEVFRSIRYVITLDGDSQLPRGTARKMIGGLAHPLNRPVFDEQTDLVVKGYGIIQPRVGVALASANASPFSRIFSGHVGLDPYTSTISDVYQDLFDEGSFVGKAIYDVRAFERAMHNRVPENALLSHDLFEGVFLRVALATDIEILDEFPSRFNVFAKRQHRWIRGDWQLWPWLFPSVPDAGGRRYPTPLKRLAWWKLADNLRRSLFAPSSFLLLALSWLILPGSAMFWCLFILLVAGFPVYSNFIDALLSPPVGISLGLYLRGLARDLLRNLSQVTLTLSFLPYQSYLALNAIALTLYRLYVSKLHLLEWETAASSEKRLGTSIAAFVRQMYSGPLIAVLLGAAIVLFRPAELAEASLFLAIWMASPLLGWWASQPFAREQRAVSAADREYLEGIAWDTWCYFKDNMNERNNYLIPDNVQVVPSRVVAERTSPTNIGLGLLAQISSYDFGFAPLCSVVRRIDRTLGTLAKLEKFRGHLLNWYQTVTLQALYPRYVSTVDSGNFAADVIVLRVALRNFIYTPLLSMEHWKHLRSLLESFSATWLKENPELETCISSLLKLLQSAPSGIAEVSAVLGGIEQLVHLLGSADSSRSPGEKFEGNRSLDNLIDDFTEFVSLRELFSWCEALSTFSAELRSESGRDPELAAVEKRLAGVLRIMEGRPLTLFVLSRVHRRLDDITQRLREYQSRAGSLGAHLGGLNDELRRKLELSSAAVEALLAKISHLVDACSRILEEMDFNFLFDGGKGLFVIGYNVDEARRDPSYYDLLASEARLASLFAIAKGEVPQKHWFALGRSLADSPGGKALISWSGTMFEYLMPLLVTRDFPGTILSETYRAVVRAQRIYGRRRGVPWGVSESGYSGVDFEKTYQYRAFGVPGLGLRRGLSEDLVISPYSTMLAMPICPRDAIRNIRALESANVRGQYGFYEAIDFTRSRLSSEEDSHVIAAFFAHHQGMSLVSLNNFLHDGVMQERFHSDPSIKATELLLHERFPDRVPAIVPHQAELSLLETGVDEERTPRGEVLKTAHTRFPRTRLLSNGRYSVLVDNAGSGWSFFDRDVSLTRWREDLVSNQYGFYIFVRDRDSGKVWSVAFQPTRVEPDYYEVIFNPDKVEFKRRDFGIALQSEITISPEDNVEVRRVTVKNLSSRRRNIELTSYAEVALMHFRADAAHPAFAKMFIESEFIEEFDTLLFSRRPRSVHDQRLYLIHLVSQGVCWGRTEYESSRAEFLGRGNSIYRPGTFKTDSPLSGTVGAVLDPVFSLRTRLEIEPGGSEQTAFVTAVSGSREEALHLAQRYHEVYSVNRAFEMAWSQSNVELRHEQITIAQTHVFQKLANAVLFNVSRTRADSEIIARNRLAQSGFWRFGVSGDFPIVLARVNDPRQIKLVQEMVLAHWYLRLRGLAFDLIILNEYPGGYMEDFQRELDGMIRHGYSAGVVERPAGVYLRKLSQLSEDEVILLQAAARVVILGARGSLASQISLSGETPEAIKAKRVPFSSLKTEEFPHFEPALKNLEFANGVGGFSDNGRAYSMRISEDQLPPLPWCNVIANPAFGFLISETGGGYTWSENSRENRLTPWSNDPVSDRSGEVIYIRDSDNGRYWSATPGPVPGGEPFAVRHGFGYSEFDTQSSGVFSRLVVSGALEDRVKWWHLKLVNGDATERNLEIFLYVEWTLGVQREESARNVYTEFDAASQSLYAVNYYNNEFSGRRAFIGASAEVHTYTASREEFIGRNRDTSAPYALDSAAGGSLTNLVLAQKGYVSLSRKTGSGFDPCGAIGVHLNLQPGEEREVLFFIGEAATPEEHRASVLKFRSHKKRQSELVRVRDEWQSLFSCIQVRTPSRAMDIMLNGWLVYQTVVCRLWARSGFYQSGGAYGFRDQLQDTLALMYARPDLVKRQILLHASRQFVEGDVQHWWHPPTGRGVRTRCSDDYLWLPYIVSRYVQITGDVSILDEQAGFIEGQQLEPGQMESYTVPHVSNHSASIYEHCIIALDRALQFGPHGLPLIGCGDWNDGMNEVGVGGKGESVWLGWFLYDILLKFVDLVAERNDSYRAADYRQAAQAVRDAIERNAWDGKWYIRAYFDHGASLGGISNEECKIDSLSQSWGVISGAGDPERVKGAMEHVYSELVDRQYRLIRLLTPPFDKGALRPGYIAGYLPGVRENGGQYTHAAVWVIIATALLGDGTKAFELFDMINPVNHTSTPDKMARYRGEPYVTCGDVYSAFPYAGRAGWSWYSGSAAWLYVAGIESILGLKVRGDRFTLDPCIPADWKEFSMDFRLRNVCHHVTVVNPDGVEHGVREIQVEGRKLAENWVTPQDHGKTEGEVAVRVVMGKS